MRIVPLLLFLFHGIGGIAQSQHILLDLSASWQDHRERSDWGPNVYEYECYVYFFGGDTIINDTNYQTLRKSGEFNHSQSAPPFDNYTNIYSGEVYGFLREDTAARRTFIRIPNWPYERILYDFSVGLGPYPETHRYSGSDREVISVDSLLLVDGLHRRLTLNGGEQLIEGIGSTRGFLEGMFGANSNWITPLVCHIRDGIVDIFNEDMNCPCVTNVGIPVTTTQSLRLAPSSTADYSSLEGASPHAAYQIRAMDGRIVRLGKCTSSGSATIDMTTLATGMYVVEVLELARPRTIKIIRE